MKWRWAVELIPWARREIDKVEIIVLRAERDAAIAYARSLERRRVEAR